MKSEGKSAEMHPRNRHKGSYDFAHLAELEPGLKHFFWNKPDGGISLDFSQPEALKLLNKALLREWYGIQFWDIPPDYLCPPVPGRADYIHVAADLLMASLGLEINALKGQKVLDIGTGANLIYPIVGQGEYGFEFVAAELDEKAFRVASLIAKMNPNLKGKVEVRRQIDAEKIFEGIIKGGEEFALTICNPPFYRSQAEADAKNRPKSRNLGLEAKRNFGGQNAELHCEGGEFGFISRMIYESKAFAGQVNWFSTLVANRNNIEGLERQLQKLNAVEVRVLPISRGLKASRVLCWRW
jgi:23S rRNA (adenine1618-N6)-methyltransferase